MFQKCDKNKEIKRNEQDSEGFWSHAFQKRPRNTQKCDETLVFWNKSAARAYFFTEIQIVFDLQNKRGFGKLLALIYSTIFLEKHFA